MSFLDLVVGGVYNQEKDIDILFIVEYIVNQPIRDELGLLQQGSKISFGCDVLVFNVVFKLSLSLLQTHKMARLKSYHQTLYPFTCAKILLTVFKK